MNKSLRQIISAFLVLVLFASLGFAAMADEVHSLQVGADKTELFVNDHGKVNAYCACNDGCECKTAGCDIGYKSSNESIVEVDAEGNLTAKKIGTATVTATCKKAACKATGFVEIKVKPKAPNVSGGGVKYVLTGETVTLEASASSANQSNNSGNLTFTWQPGASSQPGTLSPAGMQGIGGNANKYSVTPTTAGTYTYTCSVYETVDGLQSAAATTSTYTVIVKDEYEVAITATNNVDTLSVGDSLWLTATLKKNRVEATGFITDNATANELNSIEWSVSDSALTLPTYNRRGSSITVTAYKNNLTGTDVTAKFTNNSKLYTGKYKIKVQEKLTVTLYADRATLLVKDISDAPAVQNVKVGDKYAYLSSSSTMPADSYIYTVRYSIDDPSIASVNETTGRVTAIKAGNAKVTAHVDAKKNGVIVAYTEKVCEITVINNNFDIVYNVKLGSSVALTDDVFSSWFKSVAGSSYSLSYVNFGAPSKDIGSFKNVASNVETGTNYYTAGNGYSGYKYLANTTYTAPVRLYSGDTYVAFPFTCVGASSSYSGSVTKSGSLYFFLTDGDVTDITYDVTSVKALLNSDFLNMYRTATGFGSATNCRVELLDLPQYGSLYNGYVSSTSTGTKVTATGVYSVTNNDTSNLTGTIGGLTYVPTSARSGKIDTVRYAAYDVAGNLIYVGNIVFKNGTVSYDVYSEGRTFSYYDFYKTSDTDPIVSVSFNQPAKGGRLFIDYRYGNGALLKSTDEFYTRDTITGFMSVSRVTFIPDAALKDDAVINYTVKTKSGAAYTATMTMKPKTRTSCTNFTDVTESNTGKWSANAIYFAYNWDLIKGTDGRTFAPTHTMTRGQLVTILYRAAGSPTVSYSSPFADVKDRDAFYYDAVIWGYSKGIVTGTTDTTFDPSGEVTREQIAVFLYRFDYVMSNKTNPTGAISLYQYTDDNKVSSFALGAMQWAVGNGIITSTSTDTLTLNPGGNATRAQVVTMLHRYLCTF